MPQAWHRAVREATHRHLDGLDRLAQARGGNPRVTDALHIDLNIIFELYIVYRSYYSIIVYIYYILLHSAYCIYTLV